MKSLTGCLLLMCGLLVPQNVVWAASTFVFCENEYATQRLDGIASCDVGYGTRSSIQMTLVGGLSLRAYGEALRPFHGWENPSYPATFALEVAVDGEFSIPGDGYVYLWVMGYSRSGGGSPVTVKATLGDYNLSEFDISSMVLLRYELGSRLPLSVRVSIGPETAISHDFGPYGSLELGAGVFFVLPGEAVDTAIGPSGTLPRVLTPDEERALVFGDLLETFSAVGGRFEYSVIVPEPRTFVSCGLALLWFAVFTCRQPRRLRS